LSHTRIISDSGSKLVYLDAFFKEKLKAYKKADKKQEKSGAIEMKHAEDKINDC